MPSRRFSPSLWMVLLAVAAVLVPTTLAASRGDSTSSTRNTYNDKRAPKPVSSLQVAAADSSSVTLDWSRAWDNIGVEGYGVYLDGTRSAQTPETHYTLQSLACGRGYTVGVDAFDDAGNRSSPTSTFVSTAACRDVTAPSVPSGVHSVAATGTSVILAWTPSTDDFGVVGYGLYVGGFWVGRWSQASATITNLSCGQTYQIGIDATDAAGNQSARTDAFFSTAPCSDRTPPSTPAGLAVTKSTQTAVSLAWTASTDPSGIAEYGLYRDGSKVASSTTTSGDVGGLECGKTYTLGVDAADKAQNRSGVATLSAATAPCSSTTPPPPSGAAPSAPPNLHTTSVSQTSVALAWDSSTAANGMSGYQVFRDGAKIGEGPGAHGGYTNEWTDAGRTCGTSYQYAVAGVDSTGAVGAKSTVTVSTAACDTTQPTQPPPTTSGPTAPAKLRTASVTQTNVNLAWDPSTASKGISAYRVSRDGVKLGEGPGSAGGYTDTWNDSGRTCGTKYGYSVVAVDTAGNVSPAATLSVTTAGCSQSSSPPPASTDTTAPTKPAGVTASTRTATSIALTWQPSTDNVGVTGYGVYRGGSRVATPTATTWILAGLTCNTSYTLGVDAVDAAGNRSQQTTVMISTTGCADTQAPSVPSGLKASNVTGTAATLSWSPSTDNVGVTGYDVMRDSAKMTSVSTTSSVQSSLSCATAYTFAVAAYDSAGNRSAPTQLVTTTAACQPTSPPPPPPPPSGVVELSGTVSSATLAQKIQAAPSGAVTVRPVQGGSVTVTGDVDVSRSSVTLQDLDFTGIVQFESGASGSKLLDSSAMGFDIFGADNVLIQGNSLDGQGTVFQNHIWDTGGNTPDGWVIRGNSFSNYYHGDDHSEALFIGYSRNGLVEQNTFTNNGTTAHIFFSWWGDVADPASSYPRSICVRGNTFNQTAGAYFDVNFRAEIPTDADIKIQRDATASTVDYRFYADC